MTRLDNRKYGNWSSPDSFLEKHREFIKTGKYLICRTLDEKVRMIEKEFGRLMFDVEDV